MNLYTLKEIIFYKLITKKERVITLQFSKEEAQELYKELKKLDKEDKI